MSYTHFSPIIRSGFPDYKMGSSRWLDFRKEQLHYFENGYEVGGTRISGYHYFFLNYYKLESSIKGGKGRKLIAPFYIDVDRDMFLMFEDCEKNGDNMIVIKGRDKGFSEFGGSIALQKTQTNYRSSIMTLFPGGESPAKENFRTKYDIGHSNLHWLFKHTAGVDNKDEIKYYYEEEDLITKQISTKGIQSQISFKTAVSKDVTKSARNQLILIDEAPEIKNLLGLVMAAEANMQRGDEKIGTILVGGTSNAMNGGYEEFRQIYFSGDNLGFRPFFIPATKKFFPFINLETGESQTVEAEKVLLEEEKKRKAVSPAAYLERLQNYPRIIEHAFINTKVNLLNKENIARQRSNIATNVLYQELIQRVDLVEVPSGDSTIVQFNLNPKGKWHIYKSPFGVNDKWKDYAGVDSVFQDEVHASGSKNAIVIYRPFINMDTIGQTPVCIYHHRYNEEGGKEKFYYDLYLTLRFYKCKALVEKTDNELFNWFKKRNILHQYCVPNPTPGYKGYYSKTTTDFGVSPHGEEFKQAERLLIDYVEYKCHNILFDKLLADMDMYGIKRNDSDSDLSDAFKWALLYAQNSITPEQTDEKKQKQKRNTIPVFDGEDWNI